VNPKNSETLTALASLISSTIIHALLLIGWSSELAVGLHTEILCGV
jgi:hypothetical protein